MTFNPEGRHPSTVSIMRWFVVDHLPDRLKMVAEPIRALAEAQAGRLPDGLELTAGLRKLLEAKDCLVRAELDRDNARVVDQGGKKVY